MLRENIIRVLAEYQSAITEPFPGHKLAHFLRYDFPQSLKSLIDNPARYKFDGSAGLSKWANCPWVAVFDLLITHTAQSGYYPVYIFREDMKGVYLSLNQGITDIKDKYKGEAKQVLKVRAADFQVRLGSIPPKFPESSIDLATTSTHERAAYYEAGNIYARYYPSNNIPTEEQLIADYREMLRLYELLSYSENIPIATSQVEQDEVGLPRILEDLTRLREHKRIERNARLSRATKKIHGYTCQACGFNFSKAYGPLGKDFIEAHHLKPITELKGKVVELDPKSDFAVLCSNCHSMIHKFEKPQDIEAFKNILRF